MGYQAVVNRGVKIGNRSYDSDFTQTSNLKVGFDVTVPAAKTGTLTVRTDNTTGSLTMQNGHGLTTGVKFDLYWVGGSRHGVVAGTVATNVVPISGGAGDNLPVAASAITAMIPVSEDLVATGDNVVGIAGSNLNTADPDSGKSATISLAEDDGTIAYALTPDAGESQTWFSADGVTNPVAGAAITQVLLSHGDSTKSARLVGDVMYN